MDCENIKAIAPNYINHAASESDIAAVEEHLCICNDCRQFLSQLMDQPQTKKQIKPETAPIVAPVEKTLPQNSSNLGILEYSVIAIGLIVVFFFIYLLVKK